MAVRWVRFGLSLDHCEFVLSDSGSVYFAGQRKLRVHSDSWILRLKIFFDEQFQKKSRDFGTIQGDTLDIDMALVIDAASLRHDHYLVHSAEQ